MYTNIRILTIAKGIPIEYNTNETNIETIFGLYESNEIIQQFTFQVNITPDKQCLDDTVSNSKEVHINDDCILFYSFRYQVSFGHFTIQTVPILKQFLDNPLTKLLVPRHEYSIIQKNIFELLGISENRIIFLEDTTIYTINKLYKNIIYECPPPSWTEDHTYIYKLLREKLGVTPSVNPTKRIYIRRDGLPNKAYGNSESGKIRVILNEDELISMLRQYNFDVVTLGDKTLLEKKELLDNSDIIITPNGSNCMNLIFTNMANNILLLSNDKPMLHDTFMSLYSVLNKTSINYKLLTYPTNHTLGDPKNQWNSPFSVDINSLEQEIIKMTS